MLNSIDKQALEISSISSLRLAQEREKARAIEDDRLYRNRLRRELAEKKLSQRPNISQTCYNIFIV